MRITPPGLMRITPRIVIWCKDYTIAAAGWASGIAAAGWASGSGIVYVLALVRKYRTAMLAGSLEGGSYWRGFDDLFHVCSCKNLPRL
jgi:hypothetical protein